MKKNTKIKIIVLILLLFLSTGCIKQAKNEKGKVVQNETTGQTLVSNILCQPTDKTTINAYKKSTVKIEKLPECKDFKISSGKYEGLWTSFFVKPLAFILLKLGQILKSNALSLILITILIRLLIFPLTKKMAMQSEIMKKAQPELSRIQKKYANKKDQDSLMKMQTETMAVYKKYNISPASGCLVSFIQLPLLFAFFEAVQRTPAIFEEKFLALKLGTTPSIGIQSTTFYSYIILMLLIAFTTYYSFKMTRKDMPSMNSEADDMMKMMPTMMSITIIITAMFMPSGLGIYWVISNAFTIFQNIAVRRSKKNERA